MITQRKENQFRKKENGSAKLYNVPLQNKKI